MKCTVGTALALACSCALAQSGLQVAGRKVELGTPTAIAVGVKDVYWQPKGQALVYYASDADGAFIGAYDMAKGRAKDGVRLPEGTNVHFEAGLASRPVYLVVTSRDLEGGKRRWTVTTIDARALTAKDVWTNDYDSKAEVSVDVEASPSRDHALITVTDPAGRHPIVLLDGAASAVYSRDVATAWSQGSEFAGWSVDGTAYFSADQTTRLKSAVLNDIAANRAFELKLSNDQGGSVSSLPIVGLVFKFVLTAPNSGTPVFELMPTNGVLRPVLSRGPFVGEETLPHVVYPKQENALVTTSDKSGQSGALWLVRLTGDENEPYSKEGLLIAPEAQNSWMCEDGNWVAYETAGALFVRRITYGGQPFSRALIGHSP